MLKRTLFISITLLLFSSLSAQSRLEIDSVSSFDFGPQSQLSDIWGYVDTTGVEYAIVGRLRGISVVSLADTLNPVEVYRDTSAQSIWRDIKTWKKHAYVTNETSGGLEIYDLSFLPDSVSKVGNYTGVQFPFQSSHNIYIDDNGVAYIFGSKTQTSDSGTVFLDVNTDPKNPIELGNFNENYLHDGYVRGDTLYGSAVFDGVLQVIDVSDKQNPLIVGTRATPSNFTHNAWLSDDGNYIFTTDEVSGAFLTSYDVRNPANIIENDRIRSRNTQIVIPHNTHYYNGFLVTSYYTSGVSIVDAHRPDVLVETGYFDTSPNFSGGTFNGCWGVYPFLPSGLIIASDMEEGLVVLRSSYKKASYLDGRIIDCDANSISGGTVEILNTSLSESSNLVGVFKIGTTLSGTFSVKFSAPGFYEKVIDGVNLNEGITTFLQVELLDSGAGLVHQVIDNQLNKLPNVITKLSSATKVVLDTSNGQGLKTFENLPFGTYEMDAGLWGYNNICLDSISFDCVNDSILTVFNEAYEDNFNVDLGWTVSGINHSGSWVREKPIGTVDQIYVANPAVDSDKDCRENAFLTGNGFGSADANDVDSLTILTSPNFDFTNYVQPNLVFEYWFYDGGLNSNDYLLVQLVDTFGQVITIDTLRRDTVFNIVNWKQIGYDLPVYLNKGAIRNVQFAIEDNFPSNVLEAGIDNLFIQEGKFIGIEETAGMNDVEVSPNPFTNSITINAEGKSLETVILYNVEMKKVAELKNTNSSQLTNLQQLESGIYFLKIIDDQQQVRVEKLVKR